MNSDGIPVKYHEKLPYDKAVQYAALLSDFCTSSRKCLKELLPYVENDLNAVRIRTKERTEIIVVSAMDYVLIVVQNCSGKPINYDEGEAAKPAEA
ncbi:unnamed protein product [Vitrella brassicaformis CCMP3155]|uniref:Roadblock/LAMTOR2 domain-containing protein n=2 Tax=Vitrella brassicaformis TaxID=1169539 RepID=A0A0G4G5B9_VITBC|nr:unnamed protein product [Vitrella brassicaformis CCMP3155]|eukprot:CEM23765.1 unnamed protein product [Vitrella brassicaformis CCMP3155]